MEFEQDYLPTNGAPADPPRVSVAIPLHRSACFLDTIIANIEAMPRQGVEILISDRHGYDDTLGRLRERYAADPRVRCLEYRDELDWVGHLNALLEEARGEYWRFLPHDDLSPPGTLEALVAALDADPDAILAYGPTQAVDWEGRRLPERDDLHPQPEHAEQDWTFRLALEMFWKGQFNGAFKGLVRRQAVMEHRLLIRSTRGQVFPERCWLFALCLLGRFRFVPAATYIKRYYTGSTSSRWRITGRNFYSAAWVKSRYLWEVLGSWPARWYGVQDLWLNARAVARWQDTPERGARPAYRVAPGWLCWLLGQRPFSRVARLRAFRAARRRRIGALRRLPLPTPERPPVAEIPKFQTIGVE